MKRVFAFLYLMLGCWQYTVAQTSKSLPQPPPRWTEADRKYLVDNLIRSREDIIAETQKLTPAQWAFKENPDRWSINQIVEHLAIWELLFMREVSQALTQKPDSAFTRFLPDSAFLDKDPKGLSPKSALEYTKPFSFAVPLGNNEGASNVTWLTTMRNESIEYLKRKARNIRLQYVGQSGRNVHQTYLVIFAHTDRHLRQIRKVKAHSKYPK